MPTRWPGTACDWTCLTSCTRAPSALTRPGGGNHADRRRERAAHARWARDAVRGAVAALLAAGGRGLRAGRATDEACPAPGGGPGSVSGCPGRLWAAGGALLASGDVAVLRVSGGWGSAVSVSRVAV